MLLQKLSKLVLIFQKSLTHRGMAPMFQIQAHQKRLQQISAQSTSALERERERKVTIGILEWHLGMQASAAIMLLVLAES